MHTSEPLPMTTPAPTRSFWSSFAEYLGERFPVPVTLLLSVATALGAYATAQAEIIRAGNAPLIIDGTALAGCLMIFLFLFHLRVFDEHKDYQLDAETRPDRPVQRGVITLGQLKVLGAIAAAGQIALALAAGPKLAALYAIPMAYSLLMYVEFFARDWLAARIGWYAISHTVVMCLLALVLGVRYADGAFGVPPALWGFVALNLTSFLSVDVLRKIWAPPTEVDGLDSYSKRYGIPRACSLGAALIVASAAIAGWTGWNLGGRIGWLAVVAAVTAWGLFEIRGFAAAPTVKREKRLELVAGMHLLVLFLGLVVLAGVIGGAAIGIGDHYVTVGP
ncbi:MAG TPA: UbiA family prenyltransferase [Kofleriaceae bacterium]|nr:UbiA family prenyltransferase [Kofleriaceae bacterium]